MPRLKCPSCGREKVVMEGKKKKCLRCNVLFVPAKPPKAVNIGRKTNRKKEDNNSSV